MPNFKDLRLRIKEARKIAQELEQVAELDESLVKQTKANLTKAKESLVLQKMAQF